MLAAMPLQSGFPLPFGRWMISRCYLFVAFTLFVALPRANPAAP